MEVSGHAQTTLPPGPANKTMFWRTEIALALAGNKSVRNTQLHHYRCLEGKSLSSYNYEITKQEYLLMSNEKKKS
jgi:hypothetical protein